jgi:hypothetical protein
MCQNTPSMSITVVRYYPETQLAKFCQEFPSFRNKSAGAKFYQGVVSAGKMIKPNVESENNFYRLPCCVICGPSNMLTNFGKN